jgi:hypothetical protein
LLAVPIAAQTPTFHVLVLDALNGEPQPSVVVHYFCEGSGAQENSIKTGSDGKAEIHYKCKDGARIEIFANPPGNKEGVWRRRRPED